MAGIRLNIMDIKQIVRLKLNGLSNRKIADLLNVSRNTVNGYVKLLGEVDLGLEDLLKLSESDLMDLFPASSEVDNEKFSQLSQYFSYFDKELTKIGCTIYQLWDWYIKKHPNGYRHSQFSFHYNNYRKKQKGSVRLEHKAGYQIFFDFTGKKIPIVDKKTGEQIMLDVIVTILPCSQYTFAFATEGQRRVDVIEGLNEALHYYGGVPQAIVTDNLKAAVNKASRYAPQLNKTLKDFAVHYGCVLDPTRPYAPQDKALVENAVTQIYRRVFYPLSKQIFFNRDELNWAIRRLVDRHNNYRLIRRPTTRRREFESLEKKYLQPLPSSKYELKFYKRAKVQKMGYFYFSEDKHYYSVPYQYIGKHIEIQYTKRLVEVFYNRERIAFHRRDYQPGKYSTISEHLSSSQQHYSQWSLQYFQNRASHIGIATRQYVTKLILSRPYPEIGYKQSQGILMLSRQYSKERLEKACQRGLNGTQYSYRSIASILKSGFDQLELPLNENQKHIPDHDNIRGAQYYK
jgi:transposase